MPVKFHHICVCICTFKRPQLLKRLLLELDRQETSGLFSYSIVVVDNDRVMSAQHIVQSFQQLSNIEVRYCLEPEQSIALARNRAVENAKGDFIAFIDDDEYPDRQWLLTLFLAFNTFKVDGILGPVLPYYEQEPPQWIIKGKFHERPSHATGTVLHWTKTRTGNVLLRSSLSGTRPNRDGSHNPSRDVERFSRWARSEKLMRRYSPDDIPAA